MSWERRQLSLAEGILAGNVFDWGAKEVAALMEGNTEFGFTEAMGKLQGIDNNVHARRNDLRPAPLILQPWEYPRKCIALESKKFKSESRALWLC